ncbi:MAG: pentapeptide repeat-containing protein [Candidatus Peribacteraceae bacterium]|nr:pentapeptide repeat-containing protein [Candidatus Peribacteraceae bacterium]
MDSFVNAQQIFANQQFERLNVTGENIVGKEFEKCTFSKCRLLECTFRQCHFIDCTFSASLLSAIKFIDCSFMETVFQECKTIGIDWTRPGKNMRGLQFLKSDLSQSLFGYAKIPHLVLKDCIAKEVDFTGTDCSKADFEGTDFEKSIFHNTNLTEANFKRAFHYAIDFRSNILKKTVFSLPEAVSLLHSLDIVLEN